MLNIKRRVHYLRLAIALWFFPSNSMGICANRRTYRAVTPRLEAIFVLRDRTADNGYGYEEMLGFMDVFLERKTSTEEWQTLLAWKNGTQAIRVDKNLSVKESWNGV